MLSVATISDLMGFASASMEMVSTPTLMKLGFYV